MKEKLIEFLIENNVLENGFKSIPYTWLDLAIKFKIKEGYTNKQRSKSANDIWRSYKKYTSLSLKSGILDTAYNSLQRDIDGEYRSKGLTLEQLKQVSKVSDEISDKFILNIKKQFYKKDGKYLIMGCVHAPFYNLNLMKATLKLMDNIEFDGIILNGDFLDLNSLSFHDRGRLPIKNINLGVEYDLSNKLLNEIEYRLSKNAIKYYLYGNHEDRFNRHKSNVDFSKLGKTVQDPIKGLDLISRGYSILTNWKEDEITLGDLTIIHGEFCGIHTAKKHLDVFKKNILFAHTHRVQSYREGIHCAYNIGSMADFNAPVFNYATKSMKKQWTNGFAIATVVENKTSIEQIIWNKNHFVYGGNIYKA